MSRKRQRELILIGGLILLLGVLWWRLGSTPPATTVAVEPKAGTHTRTRQESGPAPDIQLSRLTMPQPKPELAGRNPFRFGAAALPPAPPGPGATLPGAPGVPGGLGTTEPTRPSGPMEPMLPPIPLKFIGMLSSANTGGKVAILSDGRFVFHGHEGDLIDGRYRVVRIGEESVQMEYFDGRGRQTIRLTGS